MKTLVFIASLICAAYLPAADDPAAELAAEIYSHKQLISKVRAMYVEAFPVEARRQHISDAVDAYMTETFPWEEFDRLAGEQIRSRFTPEEQTQILAFLRSQAGRKFTALSGDTRSPIDELLERESTALFEIVSRITESGKEPNQAVDSTPGDAPRNSGGSPQG